ncbi:hypothetical protein KUV85_08595 [Nocardioides panacisoli]|uniref:hypothetical protein n=1 Tax=Nocardioides panacisoli TaxID=627624 RepID=UPI001C63AEFE|nr:hypothetical protein [Nocardioides panacisoli]QYJ05721.1 hypothetical protein KUV85_08595 [Nocardioides panacisoli]
MQALARRGALLALVSLVLAACSLPTGGTEDAMDLTGLDDAVVRGSDRVTAVEESEQVTDGLGSTISMTLVLDDEGPPTPDQLDAVVRTVWENVPFEPNGIVLVAVDPAAGKVDLRAAAEAIPLEFQPFGQGGISILGGRPVVERYGAWEDPE